MKNIERLASANDFFLHPFFKNVFILLPLAMAVLSAAGLLFWSKGTGSQLGVAVATIFVVFDMGSFGSKYNWWLFFVSGQTPDAPAYLEKYRNILEKSRQRMAQSRVFSLDELVSYDIENVNGYLPLQPRRYIELIGSGHKHMNAELTASTTHKFQDLLAIKYFIASASFHRTPCGGKGKTAFQRIVLCDDCGTNYENACRVELIRPVKASQIKIVSFLTGGGQIAENEKVLRISLEKENGDIFVANVLAGKDTYARSVGIENEAASMSGIAATESERREVWEKDKILLSYISEHALPDDKYKAIELEWTGRGPKNRATSIKRIDLFDQKTNSHYSVSQKDRLCSGLNGWDRVEKVKNVLIFEKKEPSERVAVLGEVISLAPEDILKTIKTSVLPDGRPYVPAKTALVEEPFKFDLENKNFEYSCKIVRNRASRIEIEYFSTAPSFMVLGDLYYPGRKAVIDGEPTHIFRTNYILRGVMVPAGSHTVAFSFSPTSFHVGLIVSAIAFSVICLICMRRPRSLSRMCV